jgi:hypothetical protein
VSEEEEEREKREERGVWEDREEIEEDEKKEEECKSWWRGADNERYPVERLFRVCLNGIELEKKISLTSLNYGP